MSTSLWNQASPSTLPKNSTENAPTVRSHLKGSGRFT